MNKKFKIISLICMLININFLIFFAITLVQILNEKTILALIHFILFIICFLVNILYIIYITTILIQNKKHK